jgi:hypothetical protein
LTVYRAGPRHQQSKHVRRTALNEYTTCKLFYFTNYTFWFNILKF